ncbi:MAG: exosortase [Firmicutes bacterium HGW-Firmicutes-19]|jgi:uncharacterized membrane protein|nr:MAG: exosortase [Firmicutes bacterium HGW-Firmicutes-19]
MNEIKKMIPYLFVIAVSFYLLPLLGSSTGDFMVIMLVIMPLTCFAISCFYGFKNGWSLIFPIAVGILFIPAIFIHFNSTAWVYIVGYSVISLAGVFFGKTFKNK